MAYSCLEYDIIRSGADYYIKYKNGYCLIVSTADSKEVDKYIHYTVNSNGNLIYGIFAIMGADDFIKKSKVVINYKNQPIDLEFTWNVMETKTFVDVPIYEPKEMEGIIDIENNGNQDTIGSLPDLWVEPEVALESVIAMVKKHD